MRSTAVSIFLKFLHGEIVALSDIYIFLWVQSAYICIIVIAAIPSFMLYRDSYATTLLHTKFFISCAESAQTMRYSDCGNSEINLFFSFFRKKVATNSDIFMGPNHSIMFFSECRATDFYVF